MVEIVIVIGIYAIAYAFVVLLVMWKKNRLKSHLKCERDQNVDKDEQIK